MYISTYSMLNFYAIDKFYMVVLIHKALIENFIYICIKKKTFFLL